MVKRYYFHLTVSFTTQRISVYDIKLLYSFVNKKEMIEFFEDFLGNVIFTDGSNFYTEKNV